MTEENRRIEEALAMATKLRERQTSELNIAEFENYRRQINAPRAKNNNRPFNI